MCINVLKHVPLHCGQHLPCIGKGQALRRQGLRSQVTVPSRHTHVLHGSDTSSNVAPLVCSLLLYRQPAKPKTDTDIYVIDIFDGTVQKFDQTKIHFLKNKFLLTPSFCIHIYKYK